MNKEPWPPLSLAQHFDAPDDYVGEFGWMCGYSADPTFMNDAAERFTRQTNAQRAHGGRIALALMLDPGNPQIRVQDAPGIAHLAIRNHDERPFRLLHAKVALLGFRHRQDVGRWQLRLIMSTGNWTRQTLEESLDMVWRADLSKEDADDSEAQQACADIRAAAGLFDWLRRYFDTRLLEAAGSSEGAVIDARWREWVDVCKHPKKVRPRFFDNRELALFDAIKDVLKRNGVIRRNYLAMGFGFYEGGTSAVLPGRVVDELRGNGLLTRESKIDVCVNPSACQAIKEAVHRQLEDQGITVRPPYVPDFFGAGSATRSLHAKFMFSANWRDGFNYCSSAWLYVGSGNLTEPGFMRRAGRQSGNLEAGVVLFPDDMHWYPDKSIAPGNVATNRIPIQWDGDPLGFDDLTAGGKRTPPESTYCAPPVAYLEWHGGSAGGQLTVGDAVPTAFDVIAPVGDFCTRSEDGGYQWPGSRPRSVIVRWLMDTVEVKADVPVIDQFGRIAATELPAMDLDEAWWQLADFPMPPEPDDVEGEYELNQASTRTTPISATHDASTAIRQMMQLIENIAARQTEVQQVDWPLWCNRLEQTLSQASEEPAVKAFHVLQLNPLHPLLMKSFRPDFAEDGSTDAGERYEKVLAKIAKAWGVDVFSQLGGRA